MEYPEWQQKIRQAQKERNEAIERIQHEDKVNVFNRGAKILSAIEFDVIPINYPDPNGVWILGDYRFKIGNHNTSYFASTKSENLSLVLEISKDDCTSVVFLNEDTSLVQIADALDNLEIKIERLKEIVDGDVSEPFIEENNTTKDRLYDIFRDMIEELY